MIIDAQIQFWKKKFLPPTAIKYIENMFKTMQIEPVFEATPEKYIDEMQEAQIDKAIISTNDYSFGSKVSQIKYNEYIADCIKEYPDLFMGFCGVDPRRNNAVEIFQKGLDAGLCGLKLYPGMGFQTNEEICLPLYKIAEENEVPVSIHTGFTVGPFLIQNSNPLFLENIIENFPSLKFILCTQLGYPFMYQLVAMMRRYENIYTDMAPATVDVPDMGLVQNIIHIKFMVNERKRIMFGSYWPFSFGRVKQWVSKCKKLKLPSISRLFSSENVTKEDRDNIMGLTACELFNIKLKNQS